MLYFIGHVFHLAKEHISMRKRLVGKFIMLSFIQYVILQLSQYIKTFEGSTRKTLQNGIVLEN